MHLVLLLRSHQVFIFMYHTLYTIYCIIVLLAIVGPIDTLYVDIIRFKHYLVTTVIDLKEMFLYL